MHQTDPVLLASVYGALQELGWVRSEFGDDDDAALPRATALTSPRLRHMPRSEAATIAVYILVLMTGNLAVALALGAQVVPSIAPTPLVGVALWRAHRLCILDESETRFENLRLWLSTGWFIAAPSALDTIGLLLVH